MPTLAECADRDGTPAAAREGMAPGGAGFEILFGNRTLSDIFGHSPLTPARSRAVANSARFSHGRVGVRASGRCWRPWEREWAVCAHGGPLPNGRWCAPVMKNRAKSRFWGGF